MQKSNNYRALAVLLAVGLLGSAARSSSAALAKKSGGSGYSGKLTGSKAQKKQQLICDPDEPIEGSTSATYDPRIVSLSGFEFGPGYFGTASVEVTATVSTDGSTTGSVSPAASRTFLQSIGSFLRAPAGVETGYLQVDYSLDGTAGQIAPATGYKVTANAGVSGVDTNAFFFTYRPGVPLTSVASYTIYADTGDRGSGNHADTLTGFDVKSGREFTLDADSLAPAQVSSSLVSAPLPSAAAAGSIALATLALAARGRKRWMGV